MNTTRMKHVRTRLAGSAALLLVLAACGQSEPAADSGPAGDGAGGNASRADPSLLPPQPVRTGGGAVAADGPAGGGGASAGPVAGRATAAADAAESAVVDDLTMLAPWSSLQFVVGDGVSLPTADTGYVYAGAVAPDLDQVAALARSLGVDGDVVMVPPAEGGGWRVGPGDGSAASLYVSASGQLDWWFNQAWDRDGVSEPDCVVQSRIEEAPPEPADDERLVETGETLPAPADGELVGGDAVGPGCVFEEPEPPQGVPTADEAVARADQIVTEAGLDVSGLALETFADGWMASVSYRSSDPAQPTALPRLRLRRERRAAVGQRHARHAGCRGAVPARRSDRCGPAAQ